MKPKNIYKLILMPMLALSAIACTSKEEIVFEHEQRAFEIKDNRILIEAIMPQATKEDENIYIVGAFNGDSTAAYGKAEYKMERSAKIGVKWGIYLDPSKFEAGKTLSDGFTFISETQGYERSSLNKAVSHTLKIGNGEWSNVYVDKWAKYFEKPSDVPEIDHDGPVVFVDDQTGWTGTALYIWGDSEIFGGWPGAKSPKGTVKIDGKLWKYYDMGEANRGKKANLIFSNDGDSQIPDFKCVLNRNYYLKITTTECTLVKEEFIFPKHEGYRIYADNKTGWDVLRLYMYGDVNDLGAGWPGLEAAAESVEINGFTYIYFELKEDLAKGKKEKLIFNNAASKQIPSSGEPEVTFGELKDIFFVVTEEKAVLVDPLNREDTPTPPPAPSGKVTNLYVKDDMLWGENLHIYAHGAGEIFGAWPGALPQENVRFANVPYARFEVAAENYNKAVNLIFNNGNGGTGNQFDGPSITTDKNYFYSISGMASSALEIPSVRIYVENKSTWGSVSLYIYGEAEVFGGWPGASSAGIETIGGKTYNYYEVPAVNFGAKSNLIFNNGSGGEGNQFDGPKDFILNRDYIFSIDNSTATEVKL